MPDLLTALIREIEAHEDSKSQWQDPMMWLSRLQQLTGTYIRVRLPDVPPDTEHAAATSRHPSDETAK